MAKTKLKIRESTNEVLLLSITSSLDDYKISWEINNKFNCQLKKTDDIISSIKGINTELKFSSYQSEIDTLIINLITNKDENSIKLINIPNSDYLLKIENDSLNTIDLIKNLNTISGIIAVIDIKNNSNLSKKAQKEIKLFLTNS